MKRHPSLTDCGSCTLRRRSVLCDLAEQDIAAFQAMMHVFCYESRQTVFYEGHASLGLYVLCAGRVKLTRTGVSGQRQIVGLLDAGEVIEKHAFKEPALHEVACETLAPSQVCVIEREPYLALVRRNGELAIKIIGLLSSEVVRQMDQMDRFAFLTARQRLAGLLLELDDRFGARRVGVSPVEIALTREEVAALTGVAMETAIRLLGEFRDEGLVQLDGRKITLLQPDRLTRIART